MSTYLSMQGRSDSQFVSGLLDAALHWRRRVRQRREQVVVRIRAAVVISHVYIIHFLNMHGYVSVYGYHISNHHGLLMHHFRSLQQSLSAPSRYSTVQLNHTNLSFHEITKHRLFSSIQQLALLNHYLNNCLGPIHNLLIIIVFNDTNCYR